MTEQTEDKEFAEFLKIARQETLTDEDSKKLQDAIKAHPQWLKDPNKTDQMFPQPVMKPGKDGKLEEMTRSEACGFEKTDCIRNVINAAAALNKEQGPDGKPILSDEDFNNFANTTDSKTGRNFATVVARNIAANEFKSKKAKSAALKDVLDSNHESLLQTLEAIKTASPDLMQTKDGNAVQAVKYMQHTDEGADLNVSAQENQGETVQIGGTANDLNVQVKPANQDLNVDAEQQDNVASIEPNEQEDPGKGEKIKLERVKEQDIIDFMFNDWFLAGINYALEKVYGWIEGGVDKLCTAYLPTPKTGAIAQNQATQQPQQSNSGSRQKGSGRNTPDAATMFQSINAAIDKLTLSEESVDRFFKGAVEDIKNNADKNRKPQDWQTTTLDPTKHGDLMKHCTQLYNQDPNAFEQMLQDKEALLGTVAPGLVKESKLAATMAVLSFVSDPNNLGRALDEEAMTAIRGRQKMILADMKKTRDIMLQHNIDEYRTAHRIDPDTRLDDNAIKEIQEKTAREYGSYMNDVAQSGIDTREALAQYYDADNKSEALDTLKTTRNKFMDKLNNLGNIPNENDAQPRPRTRDDGTHDLHEEAVSTNEAERYERAVNDHQERNQSARENDRAQHNNRQHNFEQNRGSQSQTQSQSTTQSMFHTQRYGGRF